MAVVVEVIAEVSSFDTCIEGVRGQRCASRVKKFEVTNRKLVRTGNSEPRAICIDYPTAIFYRLRNNTSWEMYGRKMRTYIREIYHSLSVKP